MKGEEDLVVDEIPSSYVRRLWIGPTSSIDRTDLPYGSSAWPITLIHQILVGCNSLRSLSITYLGQSWWHRLAGIVPISVSSLCLGPVHGALDYRHLSCAPSLRTLTSIDTFMLDTEVRDLVLSPTIRTIRRVYTSGDRVLLAFAQLGYLEGAPSLETLEIVCYACSDEAAREILEDAAHRHEYDQSRVVLVPKSHMSNEKHDAMGKIFREWSVSSD